MIVESLFNYYENHQKLLPPEGFQNKEIPFIIVVDREGRFVDFQDTRSPSGRRLVAASFLVPKGKERPGVNAWKLPNILWDHTGFVLGHPKSDNPKDIAMARKQHESFLVQISELSSSITNDDGILAVARFFNTHDFSPLQTHLSWEECKKIPGCNVSFSLQGETGLICGHGSVRDFVANKLVENESEEEGEESPSLVSGMCLVTGTRGIVARLHPSTPIPGAKPNAKIVSFQVNMGFDSYGKEQSYNAPVSNSVAFKYTTALNHLLAKDSNQKLRVGDATAVYWAVKSSRFVDIFSSLFEEPSKTGGILPEVAHQDLKQIAALFRAPEAGIKPELDPATSFFILGLAPNVARIAVRFWYAGTVGEVASRIEQHFDDIAIVPPPKQMPHLPLWRLLNSTASQGKTENVLPHLAGDFMKAILEGTPYPRTLLSTAVTRCHAEQSKHNPNTGKLEENVPYERAALIKAVLARQTRLRHPAEKEVGMGLDATNTNIGYRLGRLFAVLEKIQAESAGGWNKINSTIRDRFYGSASSVPVAAFSHLMKLKNHHLSKLDKHKNFYERLIAEIMDGITDFPTHLRLDDQGRFAVGYYHQRQAFFIKTDNSLTQK